MSSFAGHVKDATLARWLGTTVVAIFIVVAIGLGRSITGGASARIALTGSIMVLAFGIWAVRPKTLVYALVCWTVVLGALRRIVSYKLLGPQIGSDPLLLVEPLMLVLLATAALRQGALRLTTPMSKAVALLWVLILFGAVNPLQGSPAAGIAALTFFLPVGAFWAGRQLIDDAMLRRVLLLVGFFAVPAALYGLYQVLVGFPSWDTDWVVSQGFNALHISDVVRQFSSFSSPAEYGMFLVIGCVIWMWLVPLRLPIAFRAAVVVLLLTGVLYESGRGIVFALVATTGLLVAARRRVSLRTAALVAAVAVTLLPLAVSQVVPSTNPRQKGTQALVSHQVAGLSDPTGRESTLIGHLQLIVEGLKSTITHPAGQGISVVTIAGSKFGGISHGTEADISNAGVAMGLPGLIVYLLIAWYAFTRGYRLACARHDALALAALGVIGVTFFQWLNGGQYAISFLAWLVLGWLDRATQELERPRELPEGETA